MWVRFFEIVYDKHTNCALHTITRIANTKGGFFGNLFVLLNDDSRLDYKTNFTENTIRLLQKD
jgi:hypothetical protein